MFTMQDPTVASRMAHLHVQDRLDAADRHRLARSARTTREQPSPEPKPTRRRPRSRAHLGLRLSFR
jgi:hypothetical protein